MLLATRLMPDNILLASDELGLAFKRANETWATAEEVGNHTVRAGTSVLLAHLNLLRADYTESRRWAALGLETAEQIGNFAALQRARAILLASRVALGETVALGTLGDLLEEGIARGGNAIVSVQPIIDAFIGLGELGRVERVARVASERAAGRYRQLMAGAALADVLVRLGAGAWAEVERLIDRMLGMAEAVGARTVQAQLLVSAARLALDREMPHDARRALERSRALCAGTRQGVWAVIRAMGHRASRATRGARNPSGGRGEAPAAQRDGPSIAAPAGSGSGPRRVRRSRRARGASSTCASPRNGDIGSDSTSAAARSDTGSAPAG
jgi:hypothetical protein